MNKEYIVWGIPKDDTIEQILYTKATSLISAQKVIRLLESKHNCKELRVQVLRFDDSIDFTNTINY